MSGLARLLWASCRLLLKAPRWLSLPEGSDQASSLARQELGRFARRCGLRVVSSGIASEGGTLFVVNHISWADIAALGSLSDAGFVARGDLAHWPVIGRLARRRETLFVARDLRLESGRQVVAMREALAAGRDLILFAEGTTSGGEGVLPFRPALFAAADAARRVQPTILAYHDDEGMPLALERLRRIAWIDDDGLWQALNALSGKPITASVRFLTPLDPAAFPSRKTLAAAAHTAVAEGYAALRNRSK